MLQGWTVAGARVGGSSVAAKWMRALCQLLEKPSARDRRRLPRELDSSWARRRLDQYSRAEGGVGMKLRVEAGEEVRGTQLRARPMTLMPVRLHWRSRLHESWGGNWSPTNPTVSAQTKAEDGSRLGPCRHAPATQVGRVPLPRARLCGRSNRPHARAVLPNTARSGGETPDLRCSISWQ